MLSIVLFVIVFSLMLAMVDDGGALVSSKKVMKVEVEIGVVEEKGVVEQIILEVENVLMVEAVEAGAGVLVEIGAGAEGEEKEASRLLDRNGRMLRGAALINRKKKLGIE